MATHVMAVESSCDDTSIALLRAEPGDEVPRLVSWSVQSQNDVHEKFGGVVPELASRAHLYNLLPCMRKVLAHGGISLEDVDVFAATRQPGLIGCLLIGHTAAKTLSFVFDKPFVSCHHIESHLMSVYLEKQPPFPYLSLVVSGGHTSLYRIDGFDTYEILGVAIDDAIGEAFDKGAKVLGLGFPGGPALDLLAQSGDEKKYAFGRVHLEALNFSFSGLKSELARAVKREGENLDAASMAASFQRSLLDHLLGQLLRAVKGTKITRVAIVGGVARNSALRRRLDAWVQEGVLSEWFAPKPEFCTDNAAMIGVYAYRKYKRGELGLLTDDVEATARPKRK